MGEFDAQPRSVDTKFHIPERSGMVGSEVLQPTAAEEVTALRMAIAMSPDIELHSQALLRQGLRPEAIELVLMGLRVGMYERLECLLTTDRARLGDQTNVVMLRPRNERTAEKRPERGD